MKLKAENIELRGKIIAGIHKAGRSQFIIATHSPIILAYPDAAIYQMTPEGIHKVKYKETDTYRLYKGFLDNPEQMTSILLGDEND